MAENRISITIDADDKFSDVINKANRSLKGLGSTAKKSQGAFSQMGASIIVMNQGLQLLQQTIIPVARGLNTLLKTADKFRRMEIALTSLTGSAKFAKETFKDLVEIARQSPQDLESLTDSFVRLKATGIKDTERVLKGIINAVSAFGGSSVDIKLVALAFQQMAGKGVVSMEELRRQLGERVPTAIKILARELDLTLPELFKKVESGSLDSMVAIQALTEGFEKDFGSAASAMLNTWESSIAKLISEWELFINVLLSGGGLQTVVDLVGTLIDKMRDFNDTTLLGITIRKADIDTTVKVRAQNELMLVKLGLLNVEEAENIQLLLNHVEGLKLLEAAQNKYIDTALSNHTEGLLTFKEVQDKATDSIGIFDRKIDSVLGIAGLKGKKLNQQFEKFAFLGIESAKQWEGMEDPLVEIGKLLLSMDKITDQIAIDNAVIVLSTRDQVVELSKIESLLESIKSIDVDRAEINIELNKQLDIELQLAKQLAFFDEQAKRDLTAMFDLEVQVGKATEKKLKDLKKEAGLRKKIRDDFIKSQVSSVTGQVTGVSGAIQGGQAAGPMGAVIGFMTEALLANEGLQLAIGRVNETIGKLVEPIAEALVPALDSFNEIMKEFVPIMKDLAPVFRLIAKGIQLWNAFFFGPWKAAARIWEFLGDKIGRLSDIIQSLLDAVQILIDAIKAFSDAVSDVGDATSILPSSGGGSQWGLPDLGSPGGGIDSNPITPWHEGGLIDQGDLTRLPGMATDEGLIRAQAGERVLNRDQVQQPQGIVFNINAIDPRGTQEEIRQLIEEMQARGQLAF